MDAETILHALDMTVPRRATEVVVWVERKVEEFSASFEAKIYARLGAPLPKKFSDEIYPRVLFVRHELAGGPDVAVTPNLNNDNFDATISFGKNSGMLYGEITCAKDGYDESRRLEGLARVGSGQPYGANREDPGRRGVPDRVVEVRNEAIRRDLLLSKHLSRAEAAVREKANRVYGPRHVLLLVVNDYLVFRKISDYQALHVWVTQHLLFLSLFPPSRAVGRQCLPTGSLKNRLSG
jgi:hypothetical protein